MQFYVFGLPLAMQVNDLHCEQQQQKKCNSTEQSGIGTEERKLPLFVYVISFGCGVQIVMTHSLLNAIRFNDDCFETCLSLSKVDYMRIIYQ